MPFVIIAAAIVVVILMWWFSPAQRTKRAFRKATQVAIAEFPAGGYHKVIGRVVLGDGPLRAPLSGRPCAGYEVLVEERVRSNNNSTRWRTVIHDVETRPFMVDDGTGQVRVEPQAAELLIHKDQHSRSGTFDDPSPTEQAYLDSRGEEGQGWFFNRTLRYREGVLEPGETVAVLGFGQPDGGGMTLVPSGHGPMYISDDPSVLS